MALTMALRRAVLRPPEDGTGGGIDQSATTSMMMLGTLGWPERPGPMAVQR